MLFIPCGISGGSFAIASPPLFKQERLTLAAAVTSSHAALPKGHRPNNNEARGFFQRIVDCSSKGTSDLNARIPPDAKSGCRHALHERADALPIRVCVTDEDGSGQRSLRAHHCLPLLNCSLARTLNQEHLATC